MKTFYTLISLTALLAACDLSARYNLVRRAGNSSKLQAGASSLSRRRQQVYEMITKDPKTFGAFASRFLDNRFIPGEVFTESIDYPKFPTEVEELLQENFNTYGYYLSIDPEKANNSLAHIKYMIRSNPLTTEVFDIDWMIYNSKWIADHSSSPDKYNPFIPGGFAIILELMSK